MAARRRMSAVKAAALSLLLDAYQRRDKVGLITFRGAEATLALPPTSSIDTAARRLQDLPSGGRTPLAEGLLCAAETLRLERIRDPRRRPLLVLVTDGRATYGPDAVARSRLVADQLRRTAVASLVIDCESGRMSLGLAQTLSIHLGAQCVTVGEVGADQLVHAVRQGPGPDASRNSRAGSRRRADHPATPAAAIVDRPHRRRQRQVNRSVRAGAARLEPGLVGGHLPVRQVGPVANRRAGRLRVAGELHDATGRGGSIEWHKMGSGWSWSRKAGTDDDHAAAAAEGWQEIKRRLAEERHTCTCWTSSPTRSTGAGSMSTT